MAERAGEESSWWRVFGERSVYDSPELKVYQFDVGRPGGERMWRPVAQLQRSASVALIDSQDRVLLLRRHRFIDDKWGWELPGGPVDDDEEPDAAVNREIEEQAGYRAGRVELLVSFQPSVDLVDGDHAVFVGYDPEQSGDVVSSEGIGRAEWLALQSVLGLIAAGEIWTAPTLVGLLHVLAHRR